MAAVGPQSTVDFNAELWTEDCGLFD